MSTYADAVRPGVEVPLPRPTWEGLKEKREERGPGKGPLPWGHQLPVPQWSPRWDMLPGHRARTT